MRLFISDKAFNDLLVVINTTPFSPFFPYIAVAFSLVKTSIERILKWSTKIAWFLDAVIPSIIKIAFVMSLFIAAFFIIFPAIVPSINMSMPEVL